MAPVEQSTLSVALTSRKSLVANVEDGSNTVVFFDTPLNLYQQSIKRDSFHIWPDGPRYTLGVCCDFLAEKGGPSPIHQFAGRI